MNRKPVIGILATSNYMSNNDSFCDTYTFGNNYINKIVENGATPLLIPYVNNEIIYETLDMCDGLLLPGGNKILPSALKVIDYFYKKKKPILGICLGMQSLAVYSVNDNEKNVIQKIESDINHWPFEIYRDNNEAVVHDVYVDKNSKLYEVFNSDVINVNSVHNYMVTEVGNDFRVSIKSSDDVIEGIEYINDDNFVVGVQFHPEILPQFNNLFKVFIDKCRKGQK